VAGNLLLLLVVRGFLGAVLFTFMTALGSILGPLTALWEQSDKIARSWLIRTRMGGIGSGTEDVMYVFTRGVALVFLFAWYIVLSYLVVTLVNTLLRLV
jgi:hypothetical protein